MNVYDRIRDEEGLRLYGYKDSLGILTIGYGRNIDEDAGGKGISEREADYLMRNDVADCEADLERIFDNWDRIDLVRRGALINMRFQLGPSRFRGFANLIEAVRRYQWGLAAMEALDSLWARQTPGRAMRVSEELRSGISW